MRNAFIYFFQIIFIVSGLVLNAQVDEDIATPRSCNLLSDNGGVFINEIGNTVRNTNAEYVELVVFGSIGQTSQSVDLTGWILDDNNQSGHPYGTEPGHISFGGGCLSSVPIGSIILIYNHEEPIPGIDPSNDGFPNANGVYQIPINSACLFKKPDCPNAAYSGYDCGDTVMQVDVNKSEGIWNRYIPMRNLGDALQIRRPNGELAHALSWELGESLGVDIVVNDGTAANKAFSLIGDNWNMSENYQVTQTGSPGISNSFENENLINSIKGGSVASNFTINCNPLTPSTGTNDGGDTGSIEVIMEGGSEPFSVLIKSEDFERTELTDLRYYQINELANINYQIIVTDANGCVAFCKTALHVAGPPSIQVYNGTRTTQPLCQANLNCWVEEDLPNLLVDLFNEIIPNDVLPPCLEEGADPSTCPNCPPCPEECDLFAEEIFYEIGDPDIEAVPLFSGNISHNRWMTSYQAMGQSYTYDYDLNDRMKSAMSGRFAPSRPGRKDYAWSLTSQYDVAVGYDGAGNIGSIARKGVMKRQANGSLEYGEIDNLQLMYTDATKQNQLKSIIEGSQPEYLTKGFKPYGGIMPEGQIKYDANGNMIENVFKGIINIEYDLYNNPKEINFVDGSMIIMDYDANGNKLMMHVKKPGDDKYIVYLDGMVEDGNKSLYADGGRITDASGDFRAEFTISDHLGNGRMWFADINEDGEIKCDQSEILQEEHYYPFGMAMEGTWQNFDGNPEGNDFLPPPPGDENDNFTYNGKELENDLTGWLDYGARWMDPSLGRWMIVDPLAEVYPSWSPYSYTLNNPVKYIDPDGRNVENRYKGIIDNEGNVTYEYVDDTGGDETDIVDYYYSEDHATGEGEYINSATYGVEVDYTSGPGTHQEAAPTPGSRNTHGKKHTELIAYEALAFIFSGGSSSGVSTMGFGLNKANKVKNRVPKGKAFYDTLKGKVVKGGQFMRDKVDGYLELFKKGQKAHKVPRTTTSKTPTNIDRDMEELLKNSGRVLKDAMDGIGGGGG